MSINILKVDATFRDMSATNVEAASVFVCLLEGSIPLAQTARPVWEVLQTLYGLFDQVILSDLEFEEQWDDWVAVADYCGRLEARIDAELDKHRSLYDAEAVP